MGTKAAVTSGPVTNGSKYRSRRLSAKTPSLWRRSGWLTTSASRPAGPSNPASSKDWYPAANAAMRCRGRQPEPPRAKSITVAASAPTLGAISAGQCALCTRPMVRARGQTPAAGRGPHDQIHRRLCDVLPIPRGRPSRPGRLVQTAGKVRPDPGTDQDQARRIWPVRATTCRQTRKEAHRDDLFSGVHALLHAEPEAQLQDWDAGREISVAAQSHVVAGHAATNPALVGPGTGQRSQRRTEGPLRLLRHCRKLSFPAKGPSGGRTLLAQNAVQPELGWAPHVGHVPPDQTAATDLA